MRRATMWAVATGIGVLVGVGLWLLAPRAEPDPTGADRASGGTVPPPRPEASPELTRIQRVLSGLDERLRRLELSVAATQAPNPAQSSAEASPASDPTESTADPPESGRAPSTSEMPAGEAESRLDGQDEDPIEAVRRLRAHWDAALEAQDVDPDWTYGAEKDLGEIVRRPDLGGAQVRQIDCRTTFCSLHLVFTTTDQRESFFNGFAPAARNFGGFFMVSEGWDDTQVEVYVPRTGFQLPVQEASDAPER